MQTAERMDTAGDEAPPVLPASDAAPVRTQDDERHMSDDLEAMAQQLRAAGYVAYKPTPKPRGLPNGTVLNFVFGLGTMGRKESSHGPTQRTEDP